MNNHNNKANDVASYAFEYLAVEIAGQLQEGDSTHPPYEYLPEASVLSRWLQIQPTTPNPAEVANKFAEIMEEYLETPCDPVQLEEVSNFIVTRLTAFRDFFR